ncbi:hypothetical protein FBEOM_1791 [Fusarium beomiforme]|uniref:Gamma-glutamylcyclotransferase AIG2-like domain-containing protein n=1 Tax=Fusarium beomiforme TaxID=44412 RepID=A0A9P5AUR7_9HYPO|nr:hypothetical protein FBEOM_1791 [Fusarium beomiforme]
MDFLNALESMAQAASTRTNHKIDEAIINRYCQHEPEITISDNHWNMIRERMEEKAFDREAYQYLCNMAKPKSGSHQKLTEKQLRKLRASTFLVKLEEPLDTTSAVAQAAGLVSSIAEAITATDSLWQASSFLKINGIHKINIEAYLKASPSLATFVSTFVPCNQARKSLSPDSLHPTLGIESTLPNRRLQHFSYSPYPAQNEYPVWYFAYGTLADVDVTSKLLGYSPQYSRAVIWRGALKHWGKYKALVDNFENRKCLGGMEF